MWIGKCCFPGWGLLSLTLWRMLRGPTMKCKAVPLMIARLHWTMQKKGILEVRTCIAWVVSDQARIGLSCNTWNAHFKWIQAVPIFEEAKLRPQLFCHPEERLSLAVLRKLVNWSNWAENWNVVVKKIQSAWYVIMRKDHMNTGETIWHWPKDQYFPVRPWWYILLIQARLEIRKFSAVVGVGKIYRLAALKG